MLFALPVHSQPKPPRIQVMILGTYHMDNPGRDYIKNELDDHLAPKRQQEIREVVDRLAKWGPSKVMLESPFGTTIAQERYARFLKGDLPPTADERVQLGYSLARRLGQERVWPVDWKSDMDIDSVVDLAKRRGDQTFLRQMGEAQAQVKTMFKRVATQTVRQNLIEANSPEMERFSQAMYNRMLRVNDVPEDYRGTEVVAGWYRRNIRIFANIAATAGPGDRRILVIIGAGHAPILRQLVRDAPDMELVDVQKVLGQR